MHTQREHNMYKLLYTIYKYIDTIHGSKDRYADTYYKFVMTTPNKNMIKF